MSGDEPRPAKLYTDRLELELTLELRSPLHLGTGETWRRGNPGRREGSNEPAAFEVDEVLLGERVIDGATRHVPCVPGTSLKGLLRELMQGDAALALLLGEASEDDTEASRIGLLHVYAGFGGKPLEDEDKRKPRRRTALDPKTGAAAVQRLYAYDEVPAGTVFTFHLMLLGAGRPGAEDGLKRLLGALHARGGEIGLGRGRADGMGRFRVTGLKAKRRSLDEAGKWDNSTVAEDWLPTITAAGQAATGTIVHLRLTCDGPYLSRDPWEKGQDRSERNVIQLARSGTGDDRPPELLPTSIAGALRQRAAWLWWQDKDNRDAAVADDRDTPLRTRWLAARRAGKLGAESTERDMVGRLRPVERLFGVPGWRGLVRVREVEHLDNKGEIELASVALDRFSMAPIQGALFSIRASLKPRFSVTLEIEQRLVRLEMEQPLEKFPSPEDERLLEKLWTDLTAEGERLLLGFGTSKGFGWFEVEKL